MEKGKKHFVCEALSELKALQDTITDFQSKYFGQLLLEIVGGLPQHDQGEAWKVYDKWKIDPTNDIQIAETVLNVKTYVTSDKVDIKGLTDTHLETITAYLTEGAKHTRINTKMLSDQLKS